MNQVDFVKNQNQISSKKTSAFAWIIASIIFHLLVLLAIMTYKFNFFEQEHPKTVRPDDQVVLWTHPQQIDLKKLHQPQAPQPVPIQPKAQPEAKQEEKAKKAPEQQDLPKKMPIIVAGKQGIDLQNLDGLQNPIQYPTENTQQHKETPPSQEEPMNEKGAEKTLITKNEPLYTTSPLHFPKGTFFTTSLPQKPAAKKQSKQPLDDNKKESPNMYQHVPKSTQEKPIKTISFKDLGLGQNNTLSTFGNSAHMGIQGDSPDIPTGEELKYITYLNQMANMIVSAMRANPQNKLIHGRTYEEVVFHVKVDRAGNLLASRLIRPSKHDVINHFILGSVKLVGLFNPLPNFIAKDTFEINWRISM